MAATHIPMLHMICGKVAAGKSTLAARLAAAPGTIIIAQDSWRATLCPQEVRSHAAYRRLIPRLRATMGPHAAALLRVGLSVVLDWPANTVASRAWVRGIFEAAGAGHRLHVLDVPDALCLARLMARNAAGTHAYRVNREEFETLACTFEPPTQAEGFDMVAHARR